MTVFHPNRIRHCRRHGRVRRAEANAGSGMSTGARSDPSSWAMPHQPDATFADCRFRNGETLPQLRLN
jgi:hypothetical protein